MYLKTGNTGDSVVRAPDFGGVVGKVGKVVAFQGGGICKKVADKLHPVAGIANKLNHNILFCYCLIFLLCHRNLYKNFYKVIGFLYKPNLFTGLFLNKKGDSGRNPL